jgi:hypothetical protein
MPANGNKPVPRHCGFKKLKTMDNIKNNSPTYGYLLENYYLIVERRFGCSNDTQSYAGGSISS